MCDIYAVIEFFGKCPQFTIIKENAGDVDIKNSDFGFVREIFVEEHITASDEGESGQRVPAFDV